MEKPQKATNLSLQDQPNLLVLLKQAQEKFGYVPEKVMLEVAQSLNTCLSEVYGVATFYSFLSDKPLAKNVIRVCKSLPCFMKNSRMIIESVADELGIRLGETTPDGKFCLAATNCIGACDLAPAMLINYDVYGDLTPKKISQILRSYP